MHVSDCLEQFLALLTAVIMQPGAIFYVHLTNYYSDKQVEEK